MGMQIIMSIGRQCKFSKLNAESANIMLKVLVYLNFVKVISSLFTQFRVKTQSKLIILSKLILT